MAHAMPSLYETTPEKVLALRDLILAESKQEQEQSAELQPEAATLVSSSPEPHEGYKDALRKAVNAMNHAEQAYVLCQSKLGLNELPWRSHIGPCFWNYAQDAFGVTGIEDGQKPRLVEPSDSMRFERLTELTKLWDRVELAIKLPGDWVKTLKPNIEGLKTAMRQRINDLQDLWVRG